MFTLLVGCWMLWGTIWGATVEVMDWRELQEYPTEAACQHAQAARRETREDLREKIYAEDGTLSVVTVPRQFTCKPCEAPPPGREPEGTP